MHRQLATVCRFVVGGLLNTGGTFILYWLLLRVLDYQIAYAISFCTGILLSYLINTRLVFRSRHTLLKLALFPLIYLASYLVGAAVLHVAVARFGISPQLGPLVSICATLPLTYVLSKLLLARDEEGAGEL